MLLPAALLVIAGSLLLAWLAGRRLPRPWNRIGAGIALLPPVAIVAALRETSILFATAISAFVLRERVGGARIIAVLIIASGVAVLRLA